MARLPRSLSRRRLMITLAALGLIAVRPSPPPVRAVAQEPDEPAAALLDGVILPDEQVTAVNGRPPLAVMVDNAPPARPQYGLDRADLVYELLVESGITRFLAVYLRQDTDWIEPVRSVRTPFLYLALELDAVLAHVGASETEGDADARSQMAEWDVRHLEELANPDAFRRDGRRRAPYNAVTSTAGLRAQTVEPGWDGPPRTAPWLFKDDFVPFNPSGGVIGRIGYAFGDFALPAFAVEWTYDQDINGYQRAMAGRPHADGRSGEILRARNVIVQLDHAEVVDHEGHVLYDSVGTGPAFVFVDGQVIEASWSKPDRADRTRYYDRDGEEIRFNRGPTWVAVLPHGSPLTWD